MPSQRFLDFRFRRDGKTFDRFGEIDFPGGSILHIHPDRSGQGWIVRDGLARGTATTPILEVSPDGCQVRSVAGATTVIWTKRHGQKEDHASHIRGDWIPADEIDYLLLQVIDSDLEILVDTNPVVLGLHPNDEGRYANKRNLGFREDLLPPQHHPALRRPDPVTFEVDP